MNEPQLIYVFGCGWAFVLLSVWGGLCIFLFISPGIYLGMEFLVHRICLLLLALLNKFFSVVLRSCQPKMRVLFASYSCKYLIFFKVFLVILGVYYSISFLAQIFIFLRNNKVEHCLFIFFTCF